MPCTASSFSRRLRERKRLSCTRLCSSQASRSGRRPDGLSLLMVWILQQQSQLSDIFEVLCPTGRLLHPDQRFETHEPKRHPRQNVSRQSVVMFLVEVEGFLYEDIDVRFTVQLALQRENDHVFFANPGLADSCVGEISCRYWRDRSISQRVERLHGALHVIRPQLYDGINIEGHPAISVCGHSQASEDEEADVRIVQCADDGFEADELHGRPPVGPVLAPCIAGPVSILAARWHDRGNAHQYGNREKPSGAASLTNCSNSLKPIRPPPPIQSPPSGAKDQDPRVGRRFEG